MMTPPTSLAQARNRMLDVHAALLECAAGTRTASGFGPRETRTASRTLARWGAVDAAGQLTPFGRELLALYRARRSA